MTIREAGLRVRANWRRKAFLSVSLTIGFTWTYFYLQRHAPFPPVPVKSFAVDRAIPFLPGAVYLYVSLWLILPIGPWLMRSKEELSRYTAGFAVVAAGGFLVFFFFPTSSPRPSDLGGVNGMYAALARIDSSRNAFPSEHAALAVFSGLCCNAVFGEGRKDAAIRCAIWLWIGGILVSTLLTKQHWLADVVAGAALGFGGYALGQRIGRLPGNPRLAHSSDKERD